MLCIVWIALGALVSAFRSRRDLLFELLAQRQPLAAFKARGKTPCIRAADRAFWNVTEHPTAAWIVQQLREAFPFDPAPKHLVFDRDRIFAAEVVRAVKSIGRKPTPTAYRSPWQNGAAERWVGSCRQELLDHVIVANEAHLRRLLRPYVTSHHEDRTHGGLEKQPPMRRAVGQRPLANAKVVALPRVGGLHHRSQWREGA